MTVQRNSTLVGWSAASILSLALTACGGGGRSDVGVTGNNGVGTTAATATAPAPTQQHAESVIISPNSSGAAATFSEAGFIDLANPFFKPFGNGRSCASCHHQSDGWSITPATAQAKFDATGGTDPLFITKDGANSPFADVSTIDARRAAYSMLLTRGVIRVGIGIPDGAEFELVTADDPYGYASSKELSLFRRPLPSTNLKFLSTVAWDGRETYKDANSNICFIGTNNCYSSVDFNLKAQANHAVLGHAQAAKDLTPEEQAAIATFEKGLFTAQIQDNNAQALTGAGANGGPIALSKNDFYFGINDVAAGDYRTKAPYTPNAMNLYDAWKTVSGDLGDPDTPPLQVVNVTLARQSIARGQELFNTKSFEMTNVAGLNDDFRLPSVKGTCTLCHNAPNAGSHPTPLLFNLGLADAARRTGDMPLYTLRNKSTGEIMQTMDPGAALQSGKWQDIGRFKVPTLRALAARAPYFHDGSAKELAGVVRFYNRRFNMGLTPQEMTDLTAFLKAL
jgi:cytochrome c peroxidase